MREEKRNKKIPACGRGLKLQSGNENYARIKLSPKGRIIIIIIIDEFTIVALICAERFCIIRKILTLIIETKTRMSIKFKIISSS